MKPNPQKPEREHAERQDWAIVLVILLLGLCCVAGAGQYALRLAPNWRLDADMGSSLDLNSQFLTSKPIAFFEPLDPAILTQPAWVNGNVFLTPGAGDVFVKNSTPLPTSDQDTPVPTVSGTIPVGTTTLAVTTSPTNTLVWIPVPATKTSKPDPAKTATNTSPAPLPEADLWIAKDSPTNTYIAGDTLTYRVRVGNNGPDNLNNVTVRDSFPAQIASWTWTCIAENGGANGCTAAASNSANFIDTVNLPNGSNIEYRVDVITLGTAGSNLTNTAAINATGYTETDPGDNQSPWTHTLVLPVADLEIIKDDGRSIYPSNDTLTYTITVRNHGPSGVLGAVVTDNIPAPIISSWTWACLAQNGGATGCDGGNSANFTDIVDLPNGASVQYTVNADTGPSFFSNLENTASVTAAGYTDPGVWPNSDTDTDAPQLGTSRDCVFGGGLSCTYILPTGASIILNLSTVVGSNGSAPDLVYYERPTHPNSIEMDFVIIEIGDGTNWYPVLYWGGGIIDNTNLSGLTEDDNQIIPFTSLYPYPGTGITIDVDDPALGIPLGTYTQIRITAPPDDGDGIAIDAIGYP